MRENNFVNRAKLATTVDRLTEDERSYLSAHLKMKEWMSDTANALEMFLFFPAL